MNIQRTLTFLFALLISMAAAAHDIEVANSDGVTIYYTYINNSTELEVSYRGTSYSTYYPDEYNGKVVIPSSVTYNGKNYPVTSIGNRAIYGCNGLTSITIPNSVTSIGDDAFYGCSGLTSITIPNSVTSIGSLAFGCCGGLTSIQVVDGNNKYDSREDCNAIIETTSNTLIIGCKNTIISNSVTSIGNYAFYGCNGLTSINIPNSVTSIGFRAFVGTTWYNNQPDGLVYAGKVAYGYKGTMPSNTSIILKDGTLGIAGEAFYSLSSLTSINIPNSVTSIGVAAFRYCSGLTSITIPNSVASIGSSAFRDCSSLTSIIIPNSVTSIGNYVFQNCSGLAEIYCYAKQVPTTGNDIFYQFDLANATLYVPASALDDYKTIEPWNGFGTILPIEEEGEEEAYAVLSTDHTTLSFYYDGLKGSREGMVYTADNFRKGVNGSWGDYADQITTVVFDGSFAAYTGATDYWFSGCSQLKTIQGMEKLNVSNIGKAAFSGCSGLTFISIPNSVTSIGAFAFQDCHALTSLVISPSVETIGNLAFDGCRSLASITIPNSVTSIGANSFYGCVALTNIMIPQNITNIGTGAFSGCTSLASISVDDGNVKYDSRDNCNAIIETAKDILLIGCKNTIIPKSVKSIGPDAFQDCNSLVSIAISIGVTTIGNSAFHRCNNLTEVYCYAKQVPTTGYNVFYEVDLTNATLYVPASALDDYKTTEPWSGFGTIVPIEEEDVDDLQRYFDSLTDNEDQVADGVYTRQFMNGHWQTLYVPFAVSYTIWAKWFEVARITAFHQYDDNSNGTIDRQELEATIVEGGTLEANTPYLIRAKSDDGATLCVSGVSGTTLTAGSTPFAADGATLTITGTYQSLTGMKTARRYHLQGGSLFIPSTDAEVLPPYRWYATISGQATSRSLTLRFTDDTTTVMAAKKPDGDCPKVYDLQGRRVDMGDPSRLPKGIYIIDGRKHTVK